MSIEVTSCGLSVDGKDVHMVMGAVHYWRLDKDLWEEILDKVKGMGFGMIETYIPWSVHEISPGSFDFGEEDPRKDLGEFLDLCAWKNIWVLVRPGPHLNSELTFFGYPERVLADPACQSVTAHGTPAILPAPPKAFPVPSYASGKFYDEVATWFDAVCPVIEKRLHPKGSVIAVQADNEMSHFFRTSAYDHDYSVGAERLFHQFLENRYGDVASLNRVYGYECRSFEDVPMLKRFDAKSKNDVPRYLDWAEYKEYYIIYGLEKITKMLKERGLDGIPVTHNYPSPLQNSPFNIPATEKVIHIQGFDMYPQKTQYDQLKRGCLMSAAQSRLPFIPEFSSGCWLFMPPVTFEDQRFTTLVTWMHGIKGISFYMLVERERWYGSAVARDGRIRQPNYDYYKRMNELLKQYNIPSLKRENDILLIHARSYQRLENASTVIDPISPFLLRMIGIGASQECSEDTLGFEEPIPIAAERWFENWYGALNHAKYPFLLGDTEMDIELLARYKIIIMPTFEFLSSSEQSRFMEYVEDGGILVIGPRIPEYDETMQPSLIFKGKFKGAMKPIDNFPGAREYSVDKGRIIVVDELPGPVDELDTAVDSLVSIAGLKRTFPSLDPMVDTSFHRYEEGSDEGILFVANPTARVRNASIKCGGAKSLKDIWDETEFVGDECIEFEIEPYTVRIMEVKK